MAKYKPKVLKVSEELLRANYRVRNGVIWWKPSIKSHHLRFEVTGTIEQALQDIMMLDSFTEVFLADGTMTPGYEFRLRWQHREAAS